MPEHVVLSPRVRLLAAVMAIALAAVSYAIWTSPDARRTAGRVLTAPLPGHSLSVQPPASTGPVIRPASRTQRTGADSEMARLSAQVAALRDRMGQRLSSRDGTGGSMLAGSAASGAPSARPAHSVASGPRAKHCWDFRWQQDAQAAYRADLSDPWGLDGPPGPNNDDGIACADLPVDPRRPPSTPVGAAKEKLPSAPPLAGLRQPQLRYFGLYTAQSPYSWSEVDAVARAVGKAPSVAGYFVGGDQDFRADAVISSWRRGMLPFFTWELRPGADMGPGGATPAAGYSLAEIADGSLDGYLRKYASAVATLGLPMAIRLDHEMNGNWYPWSVDRAVNPNGTTDYIRMWRRVHDIFQQAGATNVIWVWSPNRIAHARSDFANFYPGDAYVDWIGVGGYYRDTNEAPTFDTTLGPSLRALRDTTKFPHAPKPIMLSEIGATELGGHKAAWITDLFAALARPENADIIGFAWFNDAVTAHIGEPGAVTNDWRITSSAAATTAFAAGIADPRYAAGK